jgi:hypothetical protein
MARSTNVADNTAVTMKVTYATPIIHMQVPSRYIWVIFIRSKSKSKSKLYYDRQSVGQSILVSGTHLGPATNFSFSLKFSLDSCRLVIS